MKKVFYTLIIFGVLLFISFLNTFHEKYPDEFDSMVGGKYILQGKVPYRDWFQHHQPGAYVLASLILPFTGISFVRFRVGLAIAYFLINIGGYLVLKNRLRNNFPKNFYILVLYLVTVSATYFWGHMLLADSLSAYFLLPAYALIIIKEFFNPRYERKDVLLIAWFGFLTWFTSMTYVIVVVSLTAYAFMRYVWGLKNRREAIKTFLLMLLPYGLFFLFFLITGALKDWYFANVFYNANYYIYNYPRIVHGAPINPIRYSILIASDFLNNFQPALAGVAGLPFNNPLQTTLAFSSTAVGVYFFLTKRYAVLFPWIITLIYTNARTNPQSLKEIDYQAFVYVVTSILNGVILIKALKSDLDKKTSPLSNLVIAGGLYASLVLFWFFNAFFLGLKLEQKVYDKYMGKAPLIYDRPDVAPLINKLLTADDYAWVGPFEFQDLFYLKAKVPSKYHWFLNPAASIAEIKSGIQTGMDKNRPKIVAFKRTFFTWGGDARSFNYFLVDILDRDYQRLFEYNETLTGFEYRWKNPIQGSFDLAQTFHFRRDIMPEMINKLLELGEIEKTPK